MTLLEDHVLGRGPRDSVIVGGPGVVFAAAGLARLRIVVSAGALASLDDAELAAGLDHERGHIAHHHRFVLLPLREAPSATGAGVRPRRFKPATVRELARREAAGA